MKLKKAAALFLSFWLAVTFAGCGKDKDTSADMEFGESYPLKTQETLSYWMQINANVTASVSTFAETPYAREIEKQTGVHVEYQHPTIGAEAEQFNLLIAADELPDIIEYGWYEFPGGPGKAISDGCILPLNTYTEQYAPGFTKFLSENQEIDKMIKTDDGQYYGFPFIRNDEMLLLTAGPIVREDLILELGLGMPVTYDDWYNMLVAFKNAGVEIPLAFNATTTNEIDSLLGCFGARIEYYVDNGKVKYGPLEPEFQETLMMLAKWFREGLIDKNFTTTDSKIKDANVLLGKVGATYGSGGANLGKWIESLGEDSKIKLAAVEYPKKSAGDIGSQTKSISDKYTGQSAAITTSCKNPSLAVKYLDYLYTDRGHMLANFGVEGKSYTMVDGYPTYTEEITNNPDGLLMSQAMAKYMRSYSGGPFVQDVRYLKQYYANPRQQQALEKWSVGNAETQRFAMPKVLCKNEEAFEMAEITNNVNTYRDQMILKFITGIEDFANYDAFIEQMKKFNIEKAISIQQSAYDRYMNR